MIFNLLNLLKNWTMEFKGTNETWFLSGLEIVSMPSQVKICKVSGSTYDEAKSNALLISKSREMLAFIKSYCRYLNLADQKVAEKLIKKATELNP